MDNTMPILLVPGLVSSPRIYAPVVPALWRFGPVTVANHIRDDNMGDDRAADSRRGAAALRAGRAFDGRLHRLRNHAAGAGAGGQTGADQHPGAPRYAGGDRPPPRPDRAGAGGEYRAILDELFPGFVHPSRRDDADLRQLVYDMGDDVGAEAFVRQQTAIMGRPDSRPTLAWIKCPTLVLTGDEDNTIPNSLSKEMADGIHGAKLVILSALRPPSAGRTAAGDGGRPGRMAADLVPPCGTRVV